MAKYRVAQPHSTYDKPTVYVRACAHIHRTLSGAVRCHDKIDSGQVGSPLYWIVKDDYSSLTEQEQEQVYDLG